MSEDLNRFHPLVKNFGKLADIPTDDLVNGQTYFAYDVGYWLYSLNGVWNLTNYDYGSNVQNYLSNGDFQINDRKPATNTVLTTGQVGYAIDRWLAVCGSGTLTTVPTDMPLGYYPSPNYPLPINGVYDTTRIMGLTVSGRSALDGTRIEQQIPSVRTLAGKWVTASVMVYPNGASQTMTLALIQHFGSGGTPHGQVINLSSNIPLVTSQWNLVTYSVSLDIIFSYGLGTDGLDSLLIRLHPNYAISNNIDMYFANVQIEEGPYYKGFHKRSRQEEKELCKYFYQNSFNKGVLPANNDSRGRILFGHNPNGAAPGTGYHSIELEKEMFKIPALIFYNPAATTAGQVHNFATGAATTGTGADTTQNQKRFTVNYAAPAGSNKGDLMGVHYEARADFSD